MLFVTIISYLTADFRPQSWMELAKEDGFDCPFITRSTRAELSHGGVIHYSLHSSAVIVQFFTK